MAKKELINSGSSKGYVLRTDTGRFVSVSEGKSQPATAYKQTAERGKGGSSYRNAVSGRYITEKSGKSGKTEASNSVRFAYSMPNGEKIVTVRQDIVDRALGRKKQLAWARGRQGAKSLLARHSKLSSSSTTKRPMLSDFSPTPSTSSQFARTRSLGTRHREKREPV